MSKIKQYLDLLNASIECNDKIGTLYMQRKTIADLIFPDRIQSTKGFFKTKVTDFVIPNNWCITDPCSVTIYRHAAADVLSDMIINTGGHDDVKTFYCPHRSDDGKCTNVVCRYHKKLQEYEKLTKQIQDAERERDAVRAQRVTAWKNIFSRNAK